MKHNIPMLPVHHMAAHALTARMETTDLKFPFLVKKKSLELASDLKFSQPYQGSSYIRGSLSSRPVFFSS